MMRFAFGAIVIVLVACRSTHADEKYSFRTEKLSPPKELAAEIQSLLDGNAIHFLDGKGQVVGTIWLRKTIPSKAAPEQVKSGLTYREIPETTIVGAIQFPQIWLDFRKQKIPAGVYTLRLGFQPQNGDHMGTAPYNEFCLLSPAAKDTKTETMEPKELHELSANAPGASHPGIILLFPGGKPQDEPKLESKPNGIWVLFVKRMIDAGGSKAELGFGIAVAGHSMAE